MAAESLYSDAGDGDLTALKPQPSLKKQDARN
jgi:hypothetical protein